MGKKRSGCAATPKSRIQEKKGCLQLLMLEDNVKASRERLNPKSGGEKLPTIQVIAASILGTHWGCGLWNPGSALDNIMRGVCSLYQS